MAPGNHPTNIPFRVHALTTAVILRSGSVPVADTNFGIRITPLIAPSMGKSAASMTTAGNGDTEQSTRGGSMRNYELLDGSWDWGREEADALTDALNERADAERRLRKQGKCGHGWRQHVATTDTDTCLHCGETGLAAI